MARLQDKAEAEAGWNKLKVARIHDKLENDEARIQDRARMNYYSLRLFGSNVYEPLQTSMDVKERKEGAAAGSEEGGQGGVLKGERVSIGQREQYFV